MRMAETSKTATNRIRVSRVCLWAESMFSSSSSPTEVTNRSEAAVKLFKTLFRSSLICFSSFCNWEKSSPFTSFR